MSLDRFESQISSTLTQPDSHPKLSVSVEDDGTEELKAESIAPSVATNLDDQMNLPNNSKSKSFNQLHKEFITKVLAHRIMEKHYRNTHDKTVSLRQEKANLAIRMRHAEMIKAGELLTQGIHLYSDYLNSESTELHDAQTYAEATLAVKKLIKETTAASELQIASQIAIIKKLDKKHDDLHKIVKMTSTLSNEISAARDNLFPAQIKKLEEELSQLKLHEKKLLKKFGGAALTPGQQTLSRDYLSLVYAGKMAAAEKLIPLGVDLNSFNPSGMNPLLALALFLKYKDICTLLQHEDVDVNATTTLQYHTYGRYLPVKSTALHIVIQTATLKQNDDEQAKQIIQKLIHHGIDIDAQNGWQQTALHIATALHNYKLAEYLLVVHGANPFLKDHNEETPRDYIINLEKNSDLYQLLLNAESNFSARVKEEEEEKQESSASSSEDIESQIEKANRDLRTKLFAHAFIRHYKKTHYVKAVKELNHSKLETDKILSAHLEESKKLEDRAHLAMEKYLTDRGEKDSFQDFQSNLDQITQDIDRNDLQNSTTFQAIEAKSSKSMLLENNLRDKPHRMLDALTGQIHEASKKMNHLLHSQIEQKEMKLAEVRSQQQTTLRLFGGTRLSEREIKQSKKFFFYITQEEVTKASECLLKGASVNYYDEETGLTPLLHVLQNSDPNIPIIRFLLDHGASPDCKTKHNIAFPDGTILTAQSSPLHTLIDLDNDPDTMDASILARLHSNPNSINTQDAHLRTPLHIAAIEGLSDWVRYLLRHEANPNIPDCAGDTPIDLVERYHSYNIELVGLMKNAERDQTPSPY
jgi:ankyrin repeat protein